jgi:CubicO group peptidase (beta-lactamase class C family)
MTRTFAGDRLAQRPFIMSSQVWTTARDLARLGLLTPMTACGMASGSCRPGGATMSAAAAPPSRRAASATAPAWWTFPADSGVPEDAFIAQGNRGQYLVVIPSRQLVIVRRGFDGTETRFDPAFTRDVLAALR